MEIVKQYRREGYDICRYLIRKKLIALANKEPLTGKVRARLMNLAEYIGVILTDYEGDIPADLPDWVLGRDGGNTIRLKDL